MTASGIRQVLKGLPLATRFELNQDENDCWVIGYHEKTIFTTKLPRDSLNNDASTSEVLRCSYHEYAVSHDVVALFKWIDRYHVLDCHGFLYRIGPADRLDDTADLFEDSPAGEEVLGLIEVHKLDITDVLSVNFVPPNFIAVISYKPVEAHVAFYLYALDTFDVVHSTTILRHVLAKPEKMFMEHVASNEMEKEFILSWFPHFNPAELSYGYVLIFNCNESMCCLQLGLDVFKIGFFFTWTSSCVFASFSSPTLPGNETSRNSLLLSFEDGAIVKLSRSGGQILHFTLPRMKSACYMADAFICSDYSDCHWTSLQINPISRALPLKGIISYCPIGNSDRVLALTNFGGLYSVKLDVQTSESRFLIPEISSFEETIRNIDYLDQLNAKIITQNRSIKCVAIAVNADNFQFHLDVQVIQIVRKHHVLRVTCEFLMSDSASTVISAKDWHVVLTATSKTSEKLVDIHQLQRDFTTAEPLVFLSCLKLTDVEVMDYVISVKLISFFGEGKYRPTLSLGKVNLSVTSFLQPEDSSLHSAHNDIEASMGELLLKNVRGSSDTIPDKELGESTVKIPLNETSPETLVSKLLEKSQALWRAQAWKDVCEASSFRLVVHGSSLTLSIKDQTVTISSPDPGLITLMKYAVFKIANPSSVSVFTEKNLVEAENLLKNLEIMEFSQEEPSCADVYDVYRRKVKEINDPISCTVSFFE